MANIVFLTRSIDTQDSTGYLFPTMEKVFDLKPDYLITKGEDTVISIIPHPSASTWVGITDEYDLFTVTPDGYTGIFGTNNKTQQDNRAYLPVGSNRSFRAYPHTYLQDDTGSYSVRRYTGRVVKIGLNAEVIWENSYLVTAPLNYPSERIMLLQTATAIHVLSCTNASGTDVRHTVLDKATGTVLSSTVETAPAVYLPFGSSDNPLDQTQQFFVANVQSSNAQIKFSISGAGALVMTLIPAGAFSMSTSGFLYEHDGFLYGAPNEADEEEQIVVMHKKNIATGETVAMTLTYPIGEAPADRSAYNRFIGYRTVLTWPKMFYVTKPNTNTPVTLYSLNLSTGAVAVEHKFDQHTTIGASPYKALFVDMPVYEVAGTVKVDNVARAGAIVTLLDSLGRVVKTTTTDASGRYSFKVLSQSRYAVTVVTAQGHSATHSNIKPSLILE